LITYTVKEGDMLGVIAVKYKTTIRILMDDNPIIPTNQKLLPGWKLKIYTPEENAKRHSETAQVLVERAEELMSSLETHEYMLSNPDEDEITYKGRIVLPGQIAFARVIQPTDLINIQANGYRKFIRKLSVGEILRVYETVSFQEGFYLVNNYQWVTSNPQYIQYEAIPNEILMGKFVLPTNEFRALAGTDAVSVNVVGPKPSNEQYKVAPQSFIGSGPAPTSTNKSNIAPTTPLFERPNYKRPVLQMKNGAGESTNVELRVLGFSANYGNSVRPSNTNAGWMLNIGANNLPTLNISGFLMETKAQNEFNDFMDRYHKYLEANRSGDYYAMGISTLFYKKTEYKGVVVSFSYSDREDESLHRKYNLQMLVLKEKNLSNTDISKIPTVTSRGGQTEAVFRTNIVSMLLNTVTGAGTDFY
jgi:hypothetical protein